MGKTYTISDLETLWDEYDHKQQIRALVQGRWVYTDGGLEDIKGATRAEVVRVKDHKTFIEFLKEL